MPELTTRPVGGRGWRASGADSLNGRTPAGDDLDAFRGLQTAFAISLVFWGVLVAVLVWRPA